MYSLQGIEESLPDRGSIHVNSVIAKMYSMKSAYDQVVANLGRQLKQKQMKQSGIQESLKITTQPFSANLQESEVVAIAGTGGSTNKCKHCNGFG